MKRTTKAATRSTKAKPKSAKAKTKPKSLMLLYGFDEQGRPRAAVFGETYFKLARKAADLMKLSAFVGTAAEVAPALKGIKAGRVYASGSGFVPNVRQKRFEGLLAVLKLEPPAPALPAPEAKLPTSWETIELGRLVIAQADDPSDGWWETIVESIEGDMLSLRARDFPGITVTRHRSAVALAYTPAYSSPTDLAEAAPGLPQDWTSIQPGHLVLGHDSPTEGWWEMIVVEVAPEGVLLQWRDYPKLPNLRRPLSEIALLNPQAP